MNASCAASGPEKDRWALREMIDSLPFREIQRICYGCLRSFWHRIVEQAAFTEELVGLENRDHGFLALLGHDSELYLTFWWSQAEISN
jgi:hypothetical protein